MLHLKDGHARRYDERDKISKPALVDDIRKSWMPHVGARETALHCLLGGHGARLRIVMEKEWGPKSCIASLACPRPLCFPSQPIAVEVCMVNNVSSQGSHSKSDSITSFQMCRPGGKSR